MLYPPPAFSRQVVILDEQIGEAWSYRTLCAVIGIGLLAVRTPSPVFVHAVCFDVVYVRLLLLDSSSSFEPPPPRPRPPTHPLPPQEVGAWAAVLFGYMKLRPDSLSPEILIQSHSIVAANRTQIAWF